MGYHIAYFDEVSADVQEAKHWYGSKSKGLEIEFTLAVEATIAQLVKMPTRYAIRYKKIRIAHTKVFPYNITFT
jgi:hypothetical protein